MWEEGNYNLPERHVNITFPRKTPEQRVPVAANEPTGTLHMTVIEAINPRLGVTNYFVEAATPEMVAAQAARLREGQGAWSANLQGRISAMAAWAGALGERRRVYRARRVVWQVPSRQPVSRHTDRA